MGRKLIALGMLVLISAAAGPALARAVGAQGAHHRRHHHHPQLPDLVIGSGSLTAAGGTISGSFLVSNAGRHQANKSQAVVLVAAGSKRRVVQVYAVRALKPGGTEEEAVSETVPTGLPAGTFAIRACADYRHTVKERTASNDCQKVGTVTVSSGPTGSGSTVPTAPVSFQADTPQFLADGRGQYGGTPGSDFTSGYWVDVPPSYDASNQTPTTLLVWLHGCGGQAQFDISDVSAGATQDRNYIAIAPSGPEGGGADGVPNCWDPNSDVPKVLADIAQTETHFNINRRRVIIAGYSSGGDLAYRTIFENADLFAGILAINTSPFRDTGKTLAQLEAAAAWKFNIVQVAHASDDTYPPGPAGSDPGVTATINQLKAAGYPVTYLIRPGHHYDPDTPSPCPAGDQNCIGTTYDIQHYLLPHIDADGWLAPAP
jgi:predicted esterase